MRGLTKPFKTCWSSTSVTRRSSGTSFLTCVCMPTTLPSMTLLISLLWDNVWSEACASHRFRYDAATLLQQFNSAPRFSPSAVESAAAYQAKLPQSDKENILNAQQKQKENYDRKHCKPGTYDVGAEVLQRDLTRQKRKHVKMDLTWNGPYVITKSLGKGLYSIKDKGGVGWVISRVNGYHLKPFDADSDNEVGYSTYATSYVSVTRMVNSR